MMMKTKIFVAKTIAKKSYKDAMDAMKTLKGKIKKPKGIKEKTIANFNKVKTGVKKESKRVVTFAKDYPGLSDRSSFPNWGADSPWCTRLSTAPAACS